MEGVQCMVGFLDGKRSWELGWDGHCNRMLEVADVASFYTWGPLCLGPSILRKNMETQPCG